MTVQQKRSINDVAKLLIKKKFTLAVAESVTSGNVQALLSQAEDATSFFQGGLTVYNIGQKCRHLFVEPTHALSCNCVSDKVSREMALGVCQLFSADFGIGITGYAGPVPQQGITRTFSFISIAGNGKILLSRKVFSGKLQEEEAQIFYAHKAITLLKSVLK